jgi:hypothetical protein
VEPGKTEVAAGVYAVGTGSFVKVLRKLATGNTPSIQIESFPQKIKIHPIRFRTESRGTELVLNTENWLALRDKS